MTFQAPDLGFTVEQLTPEEGWHCSHFFYQFDRQVLAALCEQEIQQGRQDLIAAVDPEKSTAPQRIQLGIVSGHKADFSLMMMDPDPLKIQSIHQQIRAGKLGPAIKTTWSYVSISEISEYVLSLDDYRKRLESEGEDASSVEKKVAAYEGRLGKMNYQRLTPNFPDYPCSCFYPMNKWRDPAANWYMQSASLRKKLMSEHARSGMKFAGKVSQLITVGIGMDDWEWGVTLWATNPKHLKQIVYDMRFDEASAKYAEFGPFYTSYQATAEAVLKFCLV